MRTLVITPTYNEAENLPRFAREILSIGSFIELLVVDDNSPDGTGALADSLSSRDPRVHVLHRPGKLGLGTAYLTGFQYALARPFSHIVQMDADFSHRPRDLPRLLEASTYADVVIGSRNVPGGHVEGWSRLRHFISKGGSLYTRLMLGLPVQDCTGGFKCWRREALESIDLNSIRSSGYSFQVEMNAMAWAQGFRLLEVPIVFPNRQAGTSKMGSGIVFEAARMVFGLRKRTGELRSQTLATYPGGRLPVTTPIRTIASVNGDEQFVTQQSQS